MQNQWKLACWEYDMFSYVWTLGWGRKFFFQVPAGECLTYCRVFSSWTGVKRILCFYGVKKICYKLWNWLAYTFHYGWITSCNATYLALLSVETKFFIAHNQKVTKSQFNSYFIVLFILCMFMFVSTLQQLIIKYVGNTLRNDTLWCASIWRTRRWTEIHTFQQLQLWNVNIWQQPNDHLSFLCCYKLFFFFSKILSYMG